MHIIMKSIMIACLIILFQHSLYFVVPCEATVTVRTYIFMKSVDSSTPSHSQTDVIETIQSSRSLLDCARDCRSHVGNKTCQNFHFHESTGVCELLESTEASRSAYLFQNPPQERTECDAPWVESNSNGVTEYALDRTTSDDTSIQLCLPLKMRVGRIVSIIGMRHQSNGYQAVRLQRSSGFPGMSISIMTSFFGELNLDNFLSASEIFDSPFAVGETFDVKLEYETKDNIKVNIGDELSREFPNGADIHAIDTINIGAILNEIRIR